MHTDKHIEHSQSLCPFKMLTGLPCPGCGITKSIIFFYEADLGKSLSYHIFGPLVVIFSLVAIIVLSLEIIYRREFLNKLLYSKKIAILLAVSLAIFHTTRTVAFISSHSFAEIMSESIWF